MGNRLCLKTTHNPFTSIHLHSVNEEHNCHNLMPFYLLYPWSRTYVSMYMYVFETKEDKSLFEMVCHFVHLSYIRAYDLNCLSWFVILDYSTYFPVLFGQTELISERDFSVEKESNLPEVSERTTNSWRPVL
jgi:hypothetical protein